MHNEAALLAWRQQLAKQFRGREEILWELEDHMLQTVEELTHSGHTPEEAVALATARLGAADTLSQEFSKVPLRSGWLPVRIVWCLAGLLAIGTVWPLMPKFSTGGTTTVLAAHMGLVMLGYAASLLIGLLASCFLITRLFRNLTDGQSAAVFHAARWLAALAFGLTAGGMSLSYWCPHEKNGPIFGWEIHEAAGVVILAWNLLIVVRCWSSRENSLSLMPLALLGSALVTISWFVASVVSSHAGIFAEGIAILALLVLAQGAIAASALAPAGWVRERVMSR